MNGLLVGAIALVGLAVIGYTTPNYTRDVFADADRHELFEPMQVEMEVSVDTDVLMSDGEPVEEFFFHLALEDEIKSWISLNTIVWQPADEGNTTVATRAPADYSTLE